MSSKLLALILFLIFSNVNINAENYNWTNGGGRKTDPIASLKAEKGGAISVYGGQSPKSLNYYLDNNTFSAAVFSAMFDSLMGVHPITKEFIQGIAEKWAIADSGLVFIFQIDSKAKWSDGTPITAADVKYTYDVIMDPASMTGVFKVGLENFYSPEILDERTIKFTAKEIHWRNLLELATLNILPRHQMESLDFNKINFEFPVVSGAYKLKKIIEGKQISLERRKDWWQTNYPDVVNTNNFDIINYKIVGNPDDAFDLFKRGEIDLYPVYTSRIWMKETDGEKFAKNWIVKQKIINQHPVGFQGFAMNMRREPFNDKRVRLALVHLLNRKMMNEKLMYSQYFLHKSYFEDLYDRNNICPNKETKFDKKKARELLAASGWKANNKGVLEKNGKEFVIRFLERDKSVEKFVNIFSEDLKDVGIKLEIDLVDFAEWAKRMDEFQFDMTWASWSSSSFKDIEGMFHSKEARRLQGNNITGFMNEVVDVISDKTKTLFNIEERHKLIRQADKIIFDEHPYVLLWNINYTRLLYWNKFGTPQTVLSKFGDDASALTYWWYDSEKDTELKDAMNANENLPPPKFEIKFDEEFGKAKKKVRR